MSDELKEFVEEQNAQVDAEMAGPTLEPDPETETEASDDPPPYDPIKTVLKIVQERADEAKKQALAYVILCLETELTNIIGKFESNTGERVGSLHIERTSNPLTGYEYELPSYKSVQETGVLKDRLSKVSLDLMKKEEVR